MSASLSDLIQRVPVYRRLSEADRGELAAVCRIMEYDRGDAVFGEGEPANDFFTVVDGRIKVFKGTPDGRIVICAIGLASIANCDVGRAAD